MVLCIISLTSNYIFNCAGNILKDYDLYGNNSQEIQDSLDEAFIQTVFSSKKDSAKEMGEFYNTFLEKIDIYLVKNILKNKINDMEINKKIIKRAILPKTKTFLENLINMENDKIQDFLNQYSKIYFEDLKNLKNKNDFLFLDI